MRINPLTDDTSPFPPFRYLYGEPVQGTAYVVFGVMVNQEQTRLPAVKQVSNVSWTNKQTILPTGHVQSRKVWYGSDTN